MLPIEVKDIRARLWQNGFRPVAVYSYDATHWSGKPIDSAGKRPKGEDWPEGARRNPPEATVSEPAKDALNTGVLCDGLIAIDVDIDDAALVAQIVELALQYMGAAPKRTRAGSSRLLMVYRSTEDESKKRTLVGEIGNVEALGNGQQFVAYGNHPTGSAYVWPEGGPDSFQREMLSPVSPQALSGFLSATASLIGANVPQEPCGAPEPAVSRPEPTERERAYAETALADECEALAAMRPGEGRNAALNRAAHSIGTMIGAGWIDPEKAAQGLWDAAERNGYRAKDGDAAALKTLQSGLDSGITKPRDPLPIIDVPDWIRQSVANMLAAYKTKHSAVATETTSRRSVTLLFGTEIQEEAISWLWDQYLPMGSLILIAGAGGVGKSTITCDIAARVTNGASWPDGTPCRKPGRVLIWSSEDDCARVIKPRLMVAGANPHGYAVVTRTTDAEGESRAFDPATDMELLRSAVEQIGGISLLVIDPIVSAITGDVNKVNEVRRNLQSIVDFASVTGCAVLGITHFSKGSAGRNASERVIGSTAFKDLSRVTLAVAKDPETDEHVMTRAKSNYSSEGGGFSFSIEVIGLRDDITANRIQWGRELKGSSRAILAEVEGDEKQDGDKMRAAKQFLIEALGSGPVPSKEVLRSAREGYGITEDTLRRAYKDIGLKPTRIGFGANGQWMWALPVAIPSR